MTIQVRPLIDPQTKPKPPPPRIATMTESLPYLDIQQLCYTSIQGGDNCLIWGGYD